MNLIERAMERLAAPGELCKDGTFGDVEGDGSVCIAGAVCASTGDADLYQRALRLIEAEIGVTDPENHWRVIPTFNDDPATTLEDALLVMKRAAARLDAES